MTKNNKGGKGVNNFVLPKRGEGLFGRGSWWLIEDLRYVINQFCSVVRSLNVAGFIECGFAGFEK